MLKTRTEPPEQSLGEEQNIKLIIHVVIVSHGEVHWRVQAERGKYGSRIEFEGRGESSQKVVDEKIK